MCFGLFENEDGMGWDGRWRVRAVSDWFIYLRLFFLP